jgi:hypothetical protein
MRSNGQLYSGEDAMYAAIRQFKAKPGSADALAERIKGAVPIISEVSGFMGYYVIYAPDDTGDRNQRLQHRGGSAGIQSARPRLDRGEPWTVGRGQRERDRRPGDRALAAVASLVPVHKRLFYFEE